MTAVATKFLYDLVSNIFPQLSPIIPVVMLLLTNPALIFSPYSLFFFLLNYFGPNIYDFVTSSCAHASVVSGDYNQLVECMYTYEKKGGGSITEKIKRDAKEYVFSMFQPEAMQSCRGSNTENPHSSCPKSS